MLGLVGIDSLNVVLPETVLSGQEMARKVGFSYVRLLEKTGVEKKPVVDSYKELISLAFESAKRSLQKSHLTPVDIDYIIFCSSGVQDRYLWSPAVAIQQELGAKHAFSFDIVNGCNSGNLGLNIAKGVLLSNPEKNVALVVVADALSNLVNYEDENHTCIFNCADAASAIVIKKGIQNNTILSFESITNSKFADHMSIPAGEQLIRMNSDPNEDLEIISEYRIRYPEVICKALAKAHLPPSAIDHLFMNQGDFKLVEYLAGSLSIDTRKIFSSYQQYGHLGGTDVFFGFDKRMNSGEIKPGQIVVLASSAVGFSWSATVIRV